MNLRVGWLPCKAAEVEALQRKGIGAAKHAAHIVQAADVLQYGHKPVLGLASILLDAQAVQLDDGALAEGGYHAAKQNDTPQRCG